MKVPLSLRGALEIARTGLIWYQERFPEVVNGSDDEALSEIDATLAAPDWISTSDRMPKPGELIVKRWKPTGAVWAGRYVDNPKHGSFDEWRSIE